MVLHSTLWKCCHCCAPLQTSIAQRPVSVAARSNGEIPPSVVRALLSNISTSTSLHAVRSANGIKMGLDKRCGSADHTTWKEDAWVVASKAVVFKMVRPSRLTALLPTWSGREWNRWTVPGDTAGGRIKKTNSSSSPKIVWVEQHIDSCSTFVWPNFQNVLHRVSSGRTKSFIQPAPCPRSHPWTNYSKYYSTYASSNTWCRLLELCRADRKYTH